MVNPRPGSVVPLYLTDLLVKKMSAKSSRSPNRLAHQANEVPHPSHTPKSAVGRTAMVASALAASCPIKPPATTAAEAAPAADSIALRVTMRLSHSLFIDEGHRLLRLAPENRQRFRGRLGGAGHELPPGLGAGRVGGEAV